MIYRRLSATYRTFNLIAHVTATLSLSRHYFGVIISMISETEEKFLLTMSPCWPITHVISINGAVYTYLEKV